jgi:pilus assembly protein Flp/PilA
MLDAMTRLFRDSRGATAIEYAVIAALIGVGLVGALGVLHDEIWTAYQNIIEGVLAAN